MKRGCLAYNNEKHINIEFELEQRNIARKYEKKCTNSENERLENFFMNSF